MLRRPQRQKRFRSHKKEPWMYRSRRATHRHLPQFREKDEHMLKKYATRVELEAALSWRRGVPARKGSKL